VHCVLLEQVTQFVGQINTQVLVELSLYPVIHVEHTKFEVQVAQGLIQSAQDLVDVM
jgi:hypothetical protein